MQFVWYLLLILYSLNFSRNRSNMEVFNVHPNLGSDLMFFWKQDRPLDSLDQTTASDRSEPSGLYSTCLCSLKVTILILNSKDNQTILLNTKRLYYWNHNICMVVTYLEYLFSSPFVILRIHVLMFNTRIPQLNNKKVLLLFVYYLFKHDTHYLWIV